MVETNKHSILKASDLSVGYSVRKQSIVIADNINFELHKGELVGLVGANGIGKSTLLRTITKVQPKLTGHVLINNKELSELNNLALAKDLSVVLTEQSASKNLSVEELVSLGRFPHTNWIGSLTVHDKSIIQTALEQTNCAELKDKKCFELSDGQLQKVMLARALAQDTQLIVLDEPTTHLDMYHKAYILNLLKALTRETGKTILFSSHEIDLAIQLCDKLIVMTEGLVISDTPENHIKQNNFDKLFPQDLISFDAKSKSFKVNK